MSFILFLFFIVGGCFTLFLTGIIADYKLEKERIKRSDFICQECRGKTPVVIHTDKK
ncbi:hypothetical protein CPT_Moonbeam12 [Bacillus phage Moonbeam]|uniref:Uncharacterized protein n=1 Tax=Bacillus phage Moonbeam TaxID=1540091 RepID=A0A0A0RMW6_9CAUD|nr:hypothetical protein CPT_Moonbeam12 [Bacillus phage Moonbeam]AIW03410.1 hypothetical protein CPT_Moonbeam12 [Bacillus phage Moonbeam]